MNRICVLVLCCGIGIATLGTAAADDGAIVNADHRRVAVDASLAREVDRLVAAGAGPAWLTWTVPVVDGRQSMCCFGKGWRGEPADRMCRLEGRNRNFGNRDDDRAPADSDLRVLLRVEGGNIGRVMAVTTDCPLDGGGLPLYSLDGVAPRQSVALLQSLAMEGNVNRDQGRTVMAIAYHSDGAADDALVELTGRRAPADLREDATFWLGAARGSRGLARLEQLLASDPDLDVREKAVFAVSISEADGALDLLIATARRHESADIREKALFWLGQQAGERAVHTLKRAVNDDPNADVREQAVFAVSQLPRDEAIPLLIELAKTNSHPEVRKSAMFWLGQSGDPRALELFEEILTR